MALLAVLVADSVDLVHEKGLPFDRRRQDLADTLADALALGMRSFWRADAYWTRLPKTKLLAVLNEAPGFADRSERSRAVALKTYAKLKKDELAAKVGEAFEGTGYPPNVLVTPVSKGCVELTDAGAAAIASE